MSITRSTIVETLHAALEPNDSVFALWLEGADAAERADEYSDIDVWVDTADGKEDETLKAIEEALSNIGQVDFKHLRKGHPHPKIRQMFFHLAGTPEYLIIDVSVQSHSRVFWYTKGHPDHVITLLFDKSGVIEYREPVDGELKQKIHERKTEIKKTFYFYQTWVKKALNRGDFLEGTYYYNQMVLEPLVELIRIRYKPQKREFYLKHATRDLPASVTKRLEPLFKVHSVRDIENNLLLANQWFDEL